MHNCRRPSTDLWHLRGEYHAPAGREAANRDHDGLPEPPLELIGISEVHAPGASLLLLRSLPTVAG